MTDSALLCWCRAGFEPELAAELSERAAVAGHPGYARTQRNSGYVEFVVEDAAALITPRTRAILLVTPGNPHGLTLSPETIASFAALARDVAAALE